DEEFLAALRELNPDLGIVIAFRMLPEVVWGMPRFGTFNLHASLLPQYRGAAPINWAIINGDTQTGVTTFLLNHEIDKGAIIGQVREKIADTDTVGLLYDRLMTIGSDLVLDSVNRIAEGNITPIEQPQSDDNLRPAPKIFKDDCIIDWRKNGADIVNFVRGLSPYPAAWSRLTKDGAEAGSAKIFEVRFEPKEGITEVGRVVTDGKKYMGVTCADGVVYIEDIQIAGKKRLKIKELLLGFRGAEEYIFE
ncbi:MAG: methionyl-tRNA formyltransferase, partial [Alistipes sp.]|nr:methionyl-tRNA formyltransferase [Alistipes sp.]